jgi:polyhydroxybutyrate depolymerase
MKNLLFLSLSILMILTNLSYAQIIKGNFNFEGKPRNYIVYLPNNYTGTTYFPLVIYLHSYGWSAWLGMNYTNLNQVADTADFIVAYPNGFPDWNSGINDNPNWPTPNVDDVGFISALIDTLINNYNIDSERIYACGYSNGGFMAYKLACQLNHRIAAIASVGGVISTNTFTNCTPFRSMPVLQIHGTMDPWVPINGTTGWHSVDQTLSYWINYNNCVQVDTTNLPDLDPNDFCTVEKISYTNCTNNSIIIYYKVINGGHTWPGAGPPGYVAGNTNQDINAGVEIWKFFNNYNLNTSIVSMVDFIPKEFVLKQNYPNPFNPSTKIRYSVPQFSNVVIKVFDILGTEIETLVNEEKPAGTYDVEFNGHSGEVRNLPSGVYFYQLIVGSFVETKKMVLLR